MFSRPLLLTQFKTVLLLSHECIFSRPLLLKVSVHNSTTTVTRIYVLKATIIESVSLQQYYYHHTNICSQGHCYQMCQFTTVMQLSHKWMFSRPLLLKVSVHNSTTTITRTYLLKNAVTKCVSLQHYYCYDTNVCCQGHCNQKCQFTTVMQLSHKWMFSRPLLFKSVSLQHYHYYITQIYVLNVTVIKSVSLQHYYFYHTNVCSQGHCY